MLSDTGFNLTGKQGKQREQLLQLRKQNDGNNVKMEHLGKHLC